jgi:DNA-binding Lrp family transcriptional regulator
MSTAYVLINSELGAEDEIIRQLWDLPGVIEVEGSYGVYDIIVKIKAPTMDNIRETLTFHLRKIEKIKSTLTLIVIEGQGEQKNAPNNKV